MTNSPLAQPGPVGKAATARRPAPRARLRLPARRLPSRREVALGHLIARAFQDDPMFVFTEPDPVRRAAILPWIFTHNVAACAADRVDEVRGEGCALWLLPPRSELDVARIWRGGLWRMPLQIGPVTTARLEATMLAAAGGPPETSDPNALYLYTLAVDPRSQGRGVASRLLRPVLAEADERGVRARLETFNPDNVPLYEHFGFRVLDSKAPFGLPRQWLMVREPGTSLAR